MGVSAYIAAAAAVAGTATSIYTSNEQSKNAKNALKQQEQLAKPKQVQAAIDPNATRQKNAADALAGIPGTLLTGAQGVDPNSLNLGRTLLGG